MTLQYMACHLISQGAGKVHPVSTSLRTCCAIQRTDVDGRRPTPAMDDRGMRPGRLPHGGLRRAVLRTALPDQREGRPEERVRQIGRQVLPCPLDDPKLRGTQRTCEAT